MGDTLIMRKKERLRKSIFDLVRAGHCTQQEASLKLGISCRHTRRSYQRYLKEGDKSLVHGNRGKKPGCAYPEEFKEEVLALYKQYYSNFGPTLASEYLQKENEYMVHAETLRLWLKDAGLWKRQRKHKKHRTRRARRARFGELLQLDGSIHAWLPGSEEKQCLMNLVDDATGKTLSFMDTGETTFAAMSLLKWWIMLHGIPLAVYVDLKSVYVSPKSLKQDESDELVEAQWLTHFSKACEQLGIAIIRAYSPQAKGRVERNHGVYQDRFVKELNFRGITTIFGANQRLQKGFIDELNKKFAKAPANPEDAHVPLHSSNDLDNIFCWENTRVVSNDWVIRYDSQYYQIEKSTCIQPKNKVVVKRHLNHEVSIWHKGEKIPVKLLADKPQKPPEEKMGISSTQRSISAKANKHKTPWGQFNPNWLSKTILSAPRPIARAIPLEESLREPCF